MVARNPQNETDPQESLYAIVRRELNNLKEQVDSIRRIVNQIVQKMTRQEETTNALKTEQEKLEQQMDDDRDERIQNQHEIEQKLLTIKARKDIVPGVSLSTLFSILAMLGAGITAYVTITSDLAVSKRDIETIRSSLEAMQAGAKDDLADTLSESKAYTDNALRLNALQTINDGTNLKGAVQNLEMSVQLLQRASVQREKEFSSTTTQAIDDLRAMESRVNAAIATIEGIQKQIETMSKTKR